MIAIAAAQDWFANLEYTDQTAGIGARFTPSSKQWDVGAQFLVGDGRGKTNLSAGSALATPGPVPDLRTKLQSLQLYGKVAVRKNVLLRFNYAYEHFRSDDWSLDNANATSSNNVLLTGRQAPGYDANVFGVSIAYTGW